MLNHTRRRRGLLPGLLVLVSTLLVSVLFMPALGAAARDREANKVLEFETMAPVSGPFVGTANPVRGFNGGGLPWVVASAEGKLSASGAIEVRVRGLVLDPNDPRVIAAGLAGVNPIDHFAVWVSCLTNDAPRDPGTPVTAGLFPATRTGNMEAKGHVNLPRPCVAPVVFVTSPANAWFAATGVGR